ncbi:MAG: DUF2088 domain-containing protein [Spirochaetia bacterium]|nr:DUF2088 domain-containing protein [Spirochaetia bacterium]
MKYRDSVWDRDHVIENMLKDQSIPRMARVRQKFDPTCIKDIPSAVEGEITKPTIAQTIKKGASIAITAGSRGVAHIDVIIKSVVDQVKKLGGVPFIIPAMGSHGGATASGQLEILEGLGITEETMGVPIYSSMEVVPIGTQSDGKTVYIDKFARDADGIIIVGRIKPHTCFRGPFESGLYKMMVIGLGKQKGAEACHEEGFGRMAHNIQTFGDVVLEKSPILFGLAIVENAFDDTALIEAVPRDEIREREPVLLEKSRSLMPGIAIHKIDVLVVDAIGKNFSGDGMDPNITGSYCTPFACGGPEVGRYVVMDISEESHGNSIGAGMADISTKRLFDKVDFDAAYPNALTCTVLKGVRIPVIMKSDEAALKAAIFSCVGADKANPRIVRIPNTSHIEVLYVSEVLKEEVMANPSLELLEDFTPIQFDGQGNIADFGKPYSGD